MFWHLQFVDDAVALWTIVLYLWFVSRRVPGENIDSEQLISFPFLLGDGVESLQLYKGPTALSKASVKETCDSDKTVNILGLKLLLVLDESHGCLHCPVVILLVQISLAEEVEVDCFRTLPRIR